MFELTYNDVMNPALSNAMETLMAHKDFHWKLAYNIARIADKFDQANRQIRDEYTKLAKENKIIDEKGAPNREVTPEQQEAFKTASEVFYKKTIKFDRHKLKISEIESAKLSPQEIFAIKDFVDGLEGGDHEETKNQKNKEKTNLQEVVQ